MHFLRIVIKCIFVCVAIFFFFNCLYTDVAIFSPSLLYKYRTCISHIINNETSVTKSSADKMKIDRNERGAICVFTVIKLLELTRPHSHYREKEDKY